MFTHSVHIWKIFNQLARYSFACFSQENFSSTITHKNLVESTLSISVSETDILIGTSGNYSCLLWKIMYSDLLAFSNNLIIFSLFLTGLTAKFALSRFSDYNLMPDTPSPYILKCASFVACVMSLIKKRGPNVFL